MKMKSVLVVLACLVITAVSLFTVSTANAYEAINTGDTGGGKLWEEGTLHDELIAALASVLNLDAATLETRLKTGEKLDAIATKQGISQKDWPAKLKAAITTAIKNGVTNGKITQTQADAILKDLEKIGNPDIRIGNGTPPPTPNGPRPTPNPQTPPPGVLDGKNPPGQGDRGPGGSGGQGGQAGQGGQGGQGRMPQGGEKLKDLFGGLLF